MKTFSALLKIGAIFIILSAGVVMLMHGASPTDAGNKITLQLGSVTVWLGMPNEEAISGLKNAGYSYLGKDGKLDWVWNKGDDNNYWLGSASGRLVYAARDWQQRVGRSEKPERDAAVMKAVVGALKTLAKSDSSQHCAVDLDSLSDPESSKERVFVRCGERSVQITVGEIYGSPMYTILDRIGEPPQ
jgi:hypothetical protein